jgi:hypothetical protein
MSPLSPATRACGRRIRGGVYAETRLSEVGMPTEYFIIDPPTPVEINELGLASVGVQLIEIKGVHHVFDVVGQEFYPYPADFVEETRRLGASRRLPANLDFSRLGPGSRLVLIHARAVIENFTDYPGPPQVDCPKGIDVHTRSPLLEMCAGLWWHDLPEEPDESGWALRQIEGGTEYRGYPHPDGVVPSYQHGVFLSLPISNLAVIQGGEATERNYQAATNCGLPVYLEEE